MEEFRFVSIGMYKLICIVCISMYSFQWFVFNGIFIKIYFSMIRRPDHRPGVDVETRASRSWLCKLVAHALSKASLLALSHRAGNGSRVTQRNERQAAEYAGGLHHRLGREHFRSDVSRAAPPLPAFIWTVVPQGFNHGT